VTPLAPRRSAGFTLIELVVGLAVSAIVMVAALGLLTSQQRTFQASADDRAIQETARQALQDVTGNLRMAGYGLDPGMAFDFGATEVPQDRALLSAGDTGVQFGGYLCPAANRVTCRDRTDGPDEIVFQYRDPAFGHLLVGAPSTSQLIIAGPLRAPLRRGQVLQVACFSGSMAWSYVTVGSTVPASEDATIRVPLLAAGADPTAYGAQNAFLADGCYTGEAHAYKIDRFRYFIGSYLADGAVVPWNTNANARPFLMLDQGLSDGDAAILTPVAPDVEDLQVSYVFPLSPAGTRVRGATGRPDAVPVRLTNDPAGIDLAPGTVPPVPLYTTDRLAVARTTGHPANIRSVRISMVVRSAEPLDASPRAVLPAIGNREPIDLVAPRHRRVTFEASVAVPNMDSRGPVFPMLGDATDPNNQLNVGGG
jgi:type IV pilus assembly protein PilW